MAVMTYREALNQALAEEMDRDPDVFLMGEEVGVYNGAYKVSKGLLERFGDMRVVDTPITELGFAGLGVGAAMTGLRPVIEFMTWNFSYLATDQVWNAAAKLLSMSAGQFKVPVTFRGPNGAALQLAAQHSQALEAIYAHFPGTKVVCPGTPADAKGLLKASIRDDDPVCFFEGEMLYNMKGEVPDDDDFVIPLGVADVKREGSDVSIITHGKMVHTALQAAAKFEEDGIQVEVLDLRTLRPLDVDAILKTVAKTNRVVCVEEGWPYGGITATVAALIQEEAFDHLDAPVLRVTQADVPMPYAKNLEKLAKPGLEHVIDKVNKVLDPVTSDMATKVYMEALSPTMEEGRLIAWQKNEGDEIKEGDVLAEVETDKATMELVARGSGVLRKRLTGDGDTTSVGTLIGVIASADEDISSLIDGAAAAASNGGANAAPAPAASAEPAPVATPEAAAQPEPASAPAATAQPAPTSAEPAVDGARMKASPLARRMAEEQGVSLQGVQGSGPGGRIVKRDVESAAQGGPASGAGVTSSAPGAPTAPFREVALTQMRKAIAKRLTQSIGPVPHFFLTVEADMTETTSLRKKILDRYADQGVKVSPNDLIIKAVAMALTRHPWVNAAWTGESIRLYNEVHIGVAVAVEEGLITPVIRNAHQKSVTQIAQEVRELAGRAKEKKLKPEEYTGSTFSISNLGMFGIEEFTAVINPPEAAILAVGAIADKVVVKDGEMVVRPMMRVTLSCDHRVIDGATAAQFLQTLKGYLEEPLMMIA